MGRHEDEVREEMARDADIMRGLGQMPSQADLGYYLGALNEAALMDGTRSDGEREARMIAAEEAEMGIDYDDREHCDKERGT